MRKTATKKGASPAPKAKKPKPAAKAKTDPAAPATTAVVAAAKPAPAKKRAAAPKAKRAPAKSAANASPKTAPKTGVRRTTRSVKKVRSVASSKNGAVRKAARRGKAIPGKRTKSVAMPIGADHRVMVKASITAMKAVEVTAKKLLAEIAKRDKAIDKLKLTVATLQVALKNERQDAKRRERDFERVLQRAEKAVNRTPARVAAKPVVKRASAPAKRRKVASFGDVLAKQEPKSKKVAAAAAAKHAAKQARHAKLKELGRQVVESAAQD